MQQNKIKNQNANIHNIDFSKANDRNKTNAINKFTTLNLKSNIMHTYLCGISIKGTRIKSAWTSAYIHSTSLKWYFNINKIYKRYAYVIEQKQKSFSYFMDRTKHNINFSKANDRNNSNAINKLTTFNFKYNICMRTYKLQIPIHHTVLKKRKN